MTSALRNWWWPSLGLALSAVVFAGWLSAAERSKVVQPEGVSVEMFAAIQSGQIHVRLIPKDSTQSRVLIENKTKQPLSVKLPDAFGGVPVLAQIGGMGGGGLGGGGLGGGLGGGTTQSVGGGMGGMGGGGMGGGGMGGGMFNVAPEKVGQLRVATVCLEHGKADPNPRVPYEIRPIEQCTDKAAVQELCRLLGNGSVSQRVAQVATWHLQNNMSWQELAGKQLRFADGTRQPYFAHQEVEAGMAAVSVAKQLAAQRQQASSSEQQTSPGDKSEHR